MKFSLSTIIAVAIAATAGSAIAAPGPLVARALEQVDSFKRGVDIYRRDPQPHDEKYTDHQLKKTSKKWTKLALDAEQRASHPDTENAGGWQRKAKLFQKNADVIEEHRSDRTARKTAQLHEAMAPWNLPVRSRS